MKIAALDVFAAQQEQDGDGDGAEDVHQRRTDGEGADRAQVGFEQARAASRKRPRLPGSMQKAFTMRTPVMVSCRMFWISASLS